VIDHVNNLKLQHLVELSKLGDRCATLEERIAAWLEEHDVVFAGRTIPFVLMPHFLSPGQVRRVRHAVVCLSRVLDRFCEAYPEDPRLRQELAVPPAEDRLIRIDPGFPRPMRICRLDAFLSGYEVRFLEFNADSPAGLGYTDVLYRGLREAIDLPRVAEEFDTAYQPMLPELAPMLLDAYGALRARWRDLPERPRVAIVDTSDSPSVPEFRIAAAALAEAGLDAVITTLGELGYDGSLLRAAGEPVHLVWRRALTEDILSEPPGAAELVGAFEEGRVCMVNPFRSLVANNKKLFALLDDPRYAHLIDGEEAHAVRATIPWTRVLRPGKASYGGWAVDLLAFVSDNRDRLVLKPAANYGGQSVFLGIETGQGDWDAVIEAHAAAGDFVVQEYVPVPEEMFPTVEDGRVQMRLKRFNINPFGVGGRYAGTLTRISDQAVINVSAGGGLLPSVVGRHKQRLLAEEEPEREEEAVHGRRV
jgi:hypothetical protein